MKPPNGADLPNQIRQRQAIVHWLNTPKHKRVRYKSLMMGGYGEEYARRHPSQIWSGESFQAILAEETAKYNARHGHNKAKAIIMLEEVIATCGETDKAVKITAIKELNRLCRIDDPSAGKEDIIQKVISPTQRIANLEEELNLLKLVENAPDCIATE